MKFKCVLMVMIAGVLLAGCTPPAAPAGSGSGSTATLLPVTASPSPESTTQPIVGVGTGPGTATPDPAGNPIPLTPPPTNGQVVTLADAGSTLILPVGQRFLLQLGEEFTWEVLSSNLDILSRVPNVLVVRGAQGLYEGHKPGTVKLTATGDPPCRQSTPPCMAPSRIFEITVIVKG